MPLQPSLTRPRCGRKLDVGMLTAKCPDSREQLEYVCDVECLRKAEFSGPFTFWRYRGLLPKVEQVVSLGEGGTPMHESRRLGKLVALSKLYLKDESQNPTNSFRDRCASLIVSNALDLGYDTLMAATAGSVGASSAAYCAKADLSCKLILPKAVDMGKLAQMIAYDSSIEEHGKTVDEAIEQAHRLWQKRPRGIKEPLS